MAEIERKKSHKMPIQTKPSFEKTLCPPPSMESNQSKSPEVFNSKSIPEKFKNFSVKKRHQSLLDEVDQEDLVLELNNI